MSLDLTPDEIQKLRLTQTDLADIEKLKETSPATFERYMSFLRTCARETKPELAVRPSMHVWCAAFMDVRLTGRVDPVVQGYFEQFHRWVLYAWQMEDENEALLNRVAELDRELSELKRGS